MKFLAIDIGSSFIKAALLDLEAGTISTQKRMPQAPRLDGSGRRHEVDADRLFEIVEHLIQEYVARHGREIGGILLSTQMHGFVLADRQARAVTPYISWQDERCLEPMPGRDPGQRQESFLEHLTSRITRQDMVETGVYLKPPLALCNLFALLQSGFAVEPGMNFCSLGSYVIFRLTGVNACHVTNAAPTGFADVRANRWSDALIQKAGAQGLAFPALIQDFPVCGIYRVHGLEIPVYPDIGDQQAGALGSLALPVRDAIVNIGTAAQLGLIRPDFVPGPYEVRPFFDSHYLYTITRLPGGRNLDVLVSFFAEAARTVTGQPVSSEDVWEIIQNRLTTIASRGLKTNCSFFQSEYSEHGCIDGIRPDNLSPFTMISAAFEDIARVYRAALERLAANGATIDANENGATPGASATVSRLVFSGGVATRLPLLRGAILKELGIGESIAPIENEVFVGLYRLALHARDRRQPILATRDQVCVESGSRVSLLIRSDREEG